MSDNFSQQAEWDYWYKKTGHAMLAVSDFGYWHCRKCEKNGDDWQDPVDFECSKEVANQGKLW